VAPVTGAAALVFLLKKSELPKLVAFTACQVRRDVKVIPD
jgi:hypothetical protein